MIAEVGHYALILALLVALVQASVPLYGANVGAPSLMAVSGYAAVVQFVLIGLAFGCLTAAFVNSDFSLAVVVANSHSTKPLFYKYTSVWGNHEGSMLLWVLILSIYGMAVALFGHGIARRLRARVLAVQGMIGVGFLAFIIFTSNPFTRVAVVPTDGQGLNPLLQDIGLAVHPPLLYLGYVGFSMAFSFSIAGLIEGRIDYAWARWVRPWTLAAWCFLTGGIALGSWWAYYELGWGGWWFWDPVENASLMPWLIGTALVHSIVVVERRDALKNWACFLAVLAFSFSLIGTFLVRSGVLSSVHAFAVDPARGVFILALLIVTTGGALILYAIRAPVVRGGALFAPISREGGLVLNNLFLCSAAATVFLGTFYPLFIDALGEGKVSVGPPYYAATFVPLMVPLLAMMAVGPMLGWRHGDIVGAVQRLKAALVAVVLSGALVLAFDGMRSLIALFGFSLAAWIVVGSLVSVAERVGLFRVTIADSWRRARSAPNAFYGMTVAHIGVGVVVLGITGITAWKSENILAMRPGESATLAGYSVSLKSVTRFMKSNYEAESASFGVSKNGAHLFDIVSERRFYPVRRSMTTEAGIHTNFLRDIYIALGEPDGSGRWAVRMYLNPTVPLIWIGALVMVIGGGLSLSDRRALFGIRRKTTSAGLAAARSTEAV